MCRGKLLAWTELHPFATKGKFSRMSVELNLIKPFIPQIFIGNRWQIAKYEGLKMVCFHYEKFKHSLEGCMVKQKEEEGHFEEQALKMDEKKKKTLKKDYESSRYSPWMVAKKNYKR